jgi:hypothetical protein
MTASDRTRIMTLDDLHPTAGGRLSLDDPLLMVAAETLNALEDARKATENRIRQLTRDVADKDGELRGFGLDPSHPDVKREMLVLEHLKAVEHEQELALKRIFRRHPMYPWARAQIGVGDKQMARLLAALGDPYIRPEIIRSDGAVEPSRPRGVRELYALCGYKPGQRRMKGVRSNWNQGAKMRAYLIAESCLKQDGEADKNGKARPLSPYRAYYDQARRHYVGKVHLSECIKCGPKGHPALPGSPLPDMCQHKRSIRFAAKMLLRDMWREARRLHAEYDGIAHLDFATPEGIGLPGAPVTAEAGIAVMEMFDE